MEWMPHEPHENGSPNFGSFGYSHEANNTCSITIGNEKSEIRRSSPSSPNSSVSRMFPTCKDGGLKQARDDFEVLLPTKLEEMGLSNFKRMNSLKKQQKIDKCLVRHNAVRKKNSNNGDDDSNGDDDWSPNISPANTPYNPVDSDDNNHHSNRSAADPASEDIGMWKVDPQSNLFLTSSDTNESYNLNREEESYSNTQKISTVKIFVENDQNDGETKSFLEDYGQIDKHSDVSSSKSLHVSSEYQHNRVERSKSTGPQRNADYPNYATIKRTFLGNSYTNLFINQENKSVNEEESCASGPRNDAKVAGSRRSSLNQQPTRSMEPPNDRNIPSIRLPDENDEVDSVSQSGEPQIPVKTGLIQPPPEHGILGHWYHNIFSHHKAKRAAKKKESLNEDIKFFFESAFSIKQRCHSPTGGFHNMIFDPSVMEAFLKLPEMKEIKELWHFIEEIEKIKTSEDILADTLFSINSIMGQDIGGTWGADSKSGSKGGSSVTLGQVRSHLKEAFQVSPETFDDILEKVRRREAANVTLTLKVIEASDLRAKTVRGASNPYVTINIPGTGQNYRTQTEHETLSPKWREEFKLKVKNLNQDLVKMEVWHDFDPNLTSQMLAVKDLKSFSRLIKGTTAIAHKHEHHLLGAVTVPMKDIRENGVSNWFPLIKEPYRDGGKQRGSLHIDAYVTATTQSISVTEARRSHDALLARLIYHHIKTATNNNTEEENVHIPWHGQLSPEAIAAIAQHAIILGLTPPLQNLSWWIVGSRVPTADAGWLLNQLKVVQKHLIEGLYDVAVIESLADSYSVWIDNNIQRLHTLRKSFPPHSGVIAKHQFSSTVATFVALESHKQSCSLLERKEIKDLRNEVKEAMIAYMNIWWSELLEQHLKGETRIEIQIQKIIIITSELYNFLCEVQSFYSPVLLKEMNIKFFREMFLLATKKLNPCVRPPIMNMYNHLESASEPSSEDADDGKPSYTLEDGSNLWQLYVNLGRINKLGADLPVEIRKESGIYEYHKWFNKGVRRWVELARKRALQMIERAVELDSLEHVDEYCNFSSSSTDVSGIFTDVQIWWHKLEWPDPENSTILLAKILEDVCSYAMKYADLLKQKVEGLFSAQSHTDQLVISQQICTGLNNIERVRDELTRLPDAFGVRFLCEKVKNSQTGGEDASNRFSNNVKTLIENSSENLEGKVVEFIEAVIEKMTGALHHAVIQACEASSEKPLLQEVLDPALQLLHGKMSESNFKRFLQRLWEGLIHLFSVTVTRNTDKRKPSYFNGVYQILEASLNFFSPCDGAGIDRNEAKSEAFLDLLELLECLRLTTENLISRYYSERYEEQKLATTNAKGELIVRAYFTKAGKLSVEIIMAKDMHLNNETGSFVGRHSQLGSYGQQIDSYVKIQFVPSDWFPNMHEARTKTMRRSDPAVFEETFDFELKHDDNGVSGGFILFTLKDYNLGRSNTFIGEALIPLKELECVDSSCVHSVQNTYLRLTQPKQECGYHSLKALALRPGDRVACTFLKKIQTRVQGAKLKLSVTTLSSDEEKSKPKSPRLLRKIMNS